MRAGPGPKVSRKGPASELPGRSEAGGRCPCGCPPPNPTPRIPPAVLYPRRPASCVHSRLEPITLSVWVPDCCHRFPGPGALCRPRPQRSLSSPDLPHSRLLTAELEAEKPGLNAWTEGSRLLAAWLPGLTSHVCPAAAWHQDCSRRASPHPTPPPPGAGAGRMELTAGQQAHGQALKWPCAPFPGLHVCYCSPFLPGDRRKPRPVLKAKVGKIQRFAQVHSQLSCEV